MKTLTLFFNCLTDVFTSFTINLPVIWSDVSIYVCLWLVVFCIIVIWAANNYRRSVRDEYLVKTTSARIKWDDEMERVQSENRSLREAFDEYRHEAQTEANERQERINQLESQNAALTAEVEILNVKSERKRNPDGTFAKTTGKGHGRKKTAAPAPDRDWTTATPEELLAEAKRRYPAGTHYLDVLGKKRHKSNREPWIYTGVQSAEGIAVCVTDWGGFVYFNGQWAQILP